MRLVGTTGCNSAASDELVMVMKIQRQVLVAFAGILIKIVGHYR
jgi:hypothetical protein